MNKHIIESKKYSNIQDKIQYLYLYTDKQKQLMFLIHVVSDSLTQFDTIKYHKQKQAIDTVIQLLQRKLSGDTVTNREFIDAADAAYTANVAYTDNAAANAAHSAAHTASAASTNRAASAADAAYYAAANAVNDSSSKLKQYYNQLVALNIDCRLFYILNGERYGK